MEGFSFSEIILIIIIAIIIYGKDLPQAARKMATIYSKFKRQLSDVREEIARQIPLEEIKDSMKIDLPSGPGGEFPSTPSSLIVSPSESNVLLTWNSSIGATSYTIRRSTNPQDPWLIVAMSIVELAWTDTDVQPGKTYHYVVSGVNGTGESGNSDEAIAVMPGSADPSAEASAKAEATAAKPPAADAAATAAVAAAPAPAPESAAPAAAPSSADPSAEASAKAEATAGKPTNGNGDYPKEPPVPEEKGTTSASPAPEVKPS